MTTPILRLDDVVVTGRLNGVTLTVEQGEHVALMGERKSGKSTVLDVITGAASISSGTITMPSRVGVLAVAVPTDVGQPASAVMDPSTVDLLLADEVEVFLPPDALSDAERMRRQAGGSLFATHQASAARRADRVIKLDGGRVGTDAHLLVLGNVLTEACYRALTTLKTAGSRALPFADPADWPGSVVVDSQWGPLAVLGLYSTPWLAYWRSGGIRPVVVEPWVWRSTLDGWPRHKGRHVPYELVSGLA